MLNFFDLNVLDQNVEQQEVRQPKIYRERKDYIGDLTDAQFRRHFRFSPQGVNKITGNTIICLKQIYVYIITIGKHICFIIIILQAF